MCAGRERQVSGANVRLGPSGPDAWSRTSAAFSYHGSAGWTTATGAAALRRCASRRSHPIIPLAGGRVVVRHRDQRAVAGHEEEIAPRQWRHGGGVLDRVVLAGLREETQNEVVTETRRVRDGK